MLSRRSLVVISLLATSMSCFLLGVYHARGEGASRDATYDARLDAIRAELRGELFKATGGEVLTAGTSGVAEGAAPVDRAHTARGRMIAEIKEELQAEMGLLPVQLLRDRRE